MIQECYDGKYKGIIIVEVTRLSRGNQGDAQIILDCLKYSNRNNGVLVITPTKTYDVAHSQEDEEYMEFELFMSRREYKMIQKRMDRGRKQAVVEGNFMGSYRPYGYNIVKTKTSRTLVPNPDEAPYVKKIYEWAVTENLSPYKIAKRLDNMGVPTYYGDTEWSEETFYKAKSRFTVDRTKSGLKLTNPLAGILRCKNCHKTIVYQSYKHRKIYSPPRYMHSQSQKCKVKSVVAEDVLKAVIHGLKLYIEDFEMKLDNLPDSNENEISNQIELLRKEIYKIERKLSKLFNSWEDDTITDNEFVERKSVHNSRIESIKQQIEELEYSIPEKEEYQEKIILLSEALKAITDKSLDAEIKNEYLKRIIDTIEFSRENNSEFILDINLC